MTERAKILEMVESGEITVEEATRRLEALAQGSPPPKQAAPPTSFEPPAFLKAIWQVVLWLGILMVVGGGLLMGAVYAWEAGSGWLICGWPLFLLGVLVVILGWWLPEARWLYVRVRQSDGPNIVVALPLPLRFIAWGLRIARPFSSDLQGSMADEVIMELAKGIRSDQPLVVEVNEGEDGEHVRVYIG